MTERVHRDRRRRRAGDMPEMLAYAERYGAVHMPPVVRLSHGVALAEPDLRQRAQCGEGFTGGSDSGSGPGVSSAKRLAPRGRELFTPKKSTAQSKPIFQQSSFT